jgi:hypothetical protein
MDGKEEEMSHLGKTVMASLIYIGRKVPWLADQLGMSRSAIYLRLKDDMWTLPQLRRMQEIFKWKTLEG